MLRAYAKVTVTKYEWDRAHTLLDAINGQWRLRREYTASATKALRTSQPLPPLTYYCVSTAFVNRITNEFADAAQDLPGRRDF